MSRNAETDQSEMSTYPNLVRRNIMPLTINTNIASLDAQNNLSKSQGSLQTSLQRLSSGLRINSAKDDAAGLAISQRFQAQISGDARASQNANDGISLAQTAEGGLSTSGDLLQRIRVLAVQSANGSNSDSDRQSIQNEVSSLTSELDRVATSTQFNGQNVLDGSLTSTQFQVGANANQTINIGIQSARSADIGNNTLTSGATSTISQAAAGIASTDANGNSFNANTVTAQTLTVTSGSGVTTPVIINQGDTAAQIAAKTNNLSEQSGVTATASTSATLSKISDGAVQFTLRGANSIANDASSQPVTISAAVKDGDLSSLAQAVNAQTGTTNIAATIQTAQDGTKELKLTDSSGDDIQLQDSGSAGLATAQLRGADTAPAVGNTPATEGTNVAVTGADLVVGGSVSYTSDAGFSISGGDGTVLANGNNGSNLQSVSKIDVSTVAGSNAALATIDAALNQINSNRASLGAIQNRFASTISNLQTTGENLSASQSRIQDTDFAAETANLTRGQILQQAGTAILAQANSLPNGVLSLLRGQSWISDGRPSVLTGPRLLSAAGDFSQRKHHDYRFHRFQRRRQPPARARPQQRRRQRRRHGRRHAARAGHRHRHRRRRQGHGGRLGARPGRRQAQQVAAGQRPGPGVFHRPGQQAHRRQAGRPEHQGSAAPDPVEGGAGHRRRARHHQQGFADPADRLNRRAARAVFFDAAPCCVAAHRRALFYSRPSPLPSGALARTAGGFPCAAAPAARRPCPRHAIIQPALRCAARRCAPNKPVFPLLKSGLILPIMSYIIALLRSATWQPFHPPASVPTST